MRIVELAGQKGHPAAVERLVGEHRVLLGDPGGGDPLVAFGVVVPGASGADPAAGDILDRAVDGQHLEQQLQRPAAQIDPSLQRRHRQWTVGFGQGAQHGVGPGLGGHRVGGEPVPDVAIFDAGQQQHVSALGGAAGASDLLVVGDR